ncbi:MAG: GYD domain-containing protein [Pseudomonadota bacterium]
MGVYVLYLVKYENDQKAAMLSDPSMRDRAEIHRNAISDFGGRPIAQFGSYGEYDMVYIYEMPDEKALAANLHLTDSFGLAKYAKAIPLLDADAMVASLALAANTETAYSPATGQGDD